MRLCEPSCVIIKPERSAVGRIMSFEILQNHLVNAIGIGRIRASISHRASSAVQVLPHHHRNFPHTWITLSWARWNHAVVEDFVIERIRPAGRFILVHRHRRVIGEVEVVQHLEHFIAAYWQERSSHAANVFLFNTTVSCQDFTLTCNLSCPFLQRELFTETVTIRGKIDNCDFVSFLKLCWVSCFVWFKMTWVIMIRVNSNLHRVFVSGERERDSLCRCRNINTLRVQCMLRFIESTYDTVWEAISCPSEYKFWTWL